MWTGWTGKGVSGTKKSRFTDVRYWLGIGLTILSLALLLRSIDFSSAGEAFRSIDLPLAAITLLTVVLTILLKAIRWKILFQPRSVQPSTAGAISILTIGQMVNFVFPLRFGEVGRVYLATEIEGSAPVLTAATILLEKTIDTLGLLICLALVVPFVPLPGWLRQPVLAATATALAAAIAILILARWHHGARIALRKLFRFLPGRAADLLEGESDAVLLSLRGLQQPSVLIQVVLLSIATWVLAVLTNYVAFLTLGISASFAAAAFSLIVLQVGVAVPSAPGRLGVFQALTVLALSVFGIAPSVALTYSILLHGVVFLPPSVAGVVLLWHENTTFRQKRLRVPGREAPAEGEPL